MELTGKAKEQFEEWYLERYFKKLIPLSMQEKFAILDSFDEIYNAMKWGVYQDFADSVGVMIELQVHAEPTMQGTVFNKFKVSILNNGSFISVFRGFITRPEARTECVDRLDELLNK